MRVTLKDVAQRVGVSTKTVSRVINNQGEISEATRQRIQQAIDELGYQPNRLARALTAGKTNLLGIIIPDIMDPFFAELILSAENTARQHGYRIVLCNANRDPDQELNYVNVLSEHQVDGFLIAGSRMDEQQLSGLMKKYRMVVLSPFRIPDAEVFSISDYDGGRQLCRYILSLGHTRLGFLGGTWAKSPSLRCNGVMDEYRAAGFSPDDIFRIETRDVTVKSGNRMAKEILGKHPEITALICYNDILAIGVLQACLQMGKKVPEELSVVGFDDIPEAERAYLPLTTYRIDKTALGAAMMEKLIRLIEDKEVIPQQTLVQGKLVIRESCQTLN